MRKEKKFSLILLIICLAALLTIMLCSVVAASDMEAVTSVTATTSTLLKQGSTGYLYVSIDSLKDVSALNIAVHFDPTKISVSSSYVYNSVSCTLHDKKANESSVQFSYIFDGNGADKKTQLFYFRYNVLADAEVGETFFDIVVNEAYDSSLNELQIKGSRCNLNIEEKITQKTCYIYSTSPISTSVDKEFDISYRLSTSQIASGSFTIEYDAELFEFVSLTNGKFFNNKIVDANTSIPGTVYISFVSNEYNSYTDLFTLRLKTKENKATTSDVKLTVKELYDLSLTYISCSGYTNKINVSYDEAYIDDQVPKVTVNAEYLKEQGQMIVKILLGENSHLGAGDFEFTFDTKYFIYNSSQKGMSPTFFTINDKNASSGKLKFSIISMSDIVTAETLVTVVLDVIPICLDFTTEFAISGSGIADSLTNLVTLNFINSTEEMQGLGHDVINHEGKEPTCLDKGWHAYEECSRCDYATEKVEISPLGHNEIVIPAKQETCTDIGWHEYVKCSRCEYTTYVEIPATGHMVIVVDKYITNLYELTNDLNYPFEYSNGIYSSTNKNHSTSSIFTITALYDFEITIRYSVSSEAICDKLFIYKNGSQLDYISGEISDREIIISLAKNDVVTVKYQKDGSVSKYNDTGYFEILTENQIEVIGEIFVPTDNFEATCTSGVICSVCNAVAKPPLPHTETPIPAVPATCTTAGSTAGVKCSVCNVVLTAPETVDATGHRYSKLSVTPASCTDDGYFTVGCGDCDAVIDSRVEADAEAIQNYLDNLGPYINIDVKAKGHNAVTDQAVAPTCTATGLTEGSHCSVCNEVLKAQETVKELGHTPGEPVVENNVPATPTTEGSYDKVVYCEICKVELSRKTEKVPPTCAHTNTEVIPAVLPLPSNNHTGKTEGLYCLDCETTLVEQNEFSVTQLASNHEFRFRAASIVLDENISVNYKPAKLNGYNNVYVVFVFEGEEYIFDTANYTETTSKGEERYVFNFKETRPQLLASNIAAYVYAETEDGFVMNCREEYSLLEYCVGQLKADKEEAYKAIISNVLVLGAEVQKVMGVNTNALATDLAVAAGCTLNPSEFGTIRGDQNVQAILGDRTTGTDWKAGTFRLGSSTEMVIKFETDSIENLKVKINIAGEDTYIDITEDTEVDEKGRYVVVVDFIKALQFNETVTATFERDGEQIGSELTYSINSYLFKNYEKESDQQAIVKALYVYGQAMYDYVNGTNNYQ